MNPNGLIEWSVAIVVSMLIISTTGIQDWIAKILGGKYSRKELEDKVISLEKRLEQLEKSNQTAGKTNPNLVSSDTFLQG